jgi:hypothetical protein
MSQLLSEAQKNYIEGVSLYSANMKSEGDKKFSFARANIQRVKLIYPMNEEAGLLELRIEQQIDPQAFAAAIQQKVNAAIAGTKRRDIQAYNDMLNLFYIYPQYPNRAAIVTQAEYDMGYRIPPANPAMVARSNELAASARAIINARADSRYDEAQGYLNDAIRIYPDNPAVRPLLSELARVRGGTTNEFDFATKRKYDQALAALQQQDYITALRLTTEIGNDPRYSNNKLYLELRRRVQAVTALQSQL